MLLNMLFNGLNIKKIIYFCSVDFKRDLFIDEYNLFFYK